MNNSEGKDIICSLLNSPNILCDFSNDIVGVELCGVLKNIYSISVGIFDSFSHSNNEHYTFLNLCFKEMKHIVDETAKENDLIHKVCCFGDFNLTSNSDKSRNRTLGLMVGKEMLNINEFNPSIIYEGIKSANAINNKCKLEKISSPIINFVSHSLDKNRNVSIRRLVDELIKE